MNWLALGLVAALAVFLGRRAARKMKVAKATAVPADDPRWVAAHERARAERDQFFTRVEAGDRPCFVGIRNGEIPAPHLDWARVVDMKDGELQIEFVDETRNACVPGDAVVDWQIEESDGNIRGGYSVRVVLDHLLSQPGTDEGVKSQRARYID